MARAWSKVLSTVGSLMVLVSVLPVPAAVAAGHVISLTTLGVTYTQDFNTLASVGTSSAVPTGWHFSESGTNANTTYTAGTGSSNAGDTYSFGASGNPERAFGGLRSGSLVPLIGAQFTNDTGSMITSLQIEYTGEQWRLGQNPTGRSADRLDFQLSTNATSLATGTWADHDDLDFSSPVVTGTVGALDGNVAPNRTLVSFTITGLAIPSGAAFWIRWLDSDLIPGADDGLSVDDFSLTPFGGDAAPQVDSTSPPNGATGVALNANVGVTFSEPVNVSGSWFGIVCGATTHTATVSGGPTTFTLNPDADFAAGQTCTVTVFAAGVTDQDANDPPDNMAADFSFSFTTVAPATLVINEIDYDQPGTDTAEFVEIKNTGAAAVDLSSFTLVLVNGASGGAAVYDTVPLPAVSLAAGDYFVVCANPATVANCDLDESPDTNFIQNGAPDAVALLQGTTLVDTVSYEGDTAAPYTEGSGVGVEDSGAAADVGISRFPDGTDTNQNNVDLSARCITPGAANTASTSSCEPDVAPSVTSVTPANGATDVPVNANVSVTFSEAVNVAGSWFGISCSVSGAHTATVGGGPGSFTLDPDVDFAGNETCTVTIFAAGVTDQDTNDPPDNMAANFSWSFTTATVDVCTLPFTPIYAIQGPGASAAIIGNVTTQGVVVGDFEGSTGLQGFYLQDLTGDGDPSTSDGIFVFTGSADTVAAGQVVRVTGFARERFNQTAINGTNSNSSPVTMIADCGSGSVAPTDVTLPFAAADFPERYEGMLVRLPQPLVISEYFNYDRFGEMVLALPLAGETRPFTGTAVEAPGAAANARTLANSLSRITLDDGLSTQNPSTVRHPNGAAFSLANRFRGGDTVQNTVGVLGFDFGLYRVQPTAPADFTSVNQRPAAPDPVGGSLHVAAMNMLNFFITADYPSGNPLDNKCGPAQNVECRGHDFDQPDEFTRQRDKLLAALAGLNADVIGLNEIENTTGVDPLGDPSGGIVTGLNAMLGAGTYAYVDTGVIGTDAIRVGLIYKPAKVAPVGDFKVLTSAVDPRFKDTLNRPVLAQTFEEVGTGARLTVAVNHLKSKGSACAGDPDTGDGQGNCNLTRKAAAEALVDWLANDPTGSGDADFLIIGDLNSYAREDPIATIEAGPDDTPGTGDDYTNLIAQHQGTFAYSFVFDGQFGYLDHALANASLAGQVTGATEWHINADEPDLLDYDTSFKPPAQDALYEPNAFRSSDHDPVLIGLDLNAPPTVDAGGPYSVDEGGSVGLSATGSDPNAGDTLTYAWDLDDNGSFETPGQNVTFSAAGLDGPSSHSVRVRVTDIGGLFAVDSATVEVANVAPTVGSPAVSPEPSVKGEAASASATFSDPGPADDPFTCTIDYGDGAGPVAGSVTGSTCTGPSHTYAEIGTYTVTVSVTDKDGGTGSSTATHKVVFAFNGFLAPIGNLPVLNEVKAGSAVPVKFSLGGDQGLAVFAAGFPRSQTITCSSTDPVNGVDETVAAGSSGLSYDAATDTYTYAWKTSKAWAGTCRQLVVKLVDGTIYRANFSFK